MKNTVKLTILVILFIIFGKVTIISFGHPIQDRSPFRYVICDNEIIDIIGNAEYAYRNVAILIDKNDFSEPNLKKLSWLVFKRFPEPMELRAVVFTSIEDIETPEEKEQPKFSEKQESLILRENPQAIIKREKDGKQIVKYNYFPDNGCAWKIVILSEDGK